MLAVARDCPRRTFACSLTDPLLHEVIAELPVAFVLVRKTGEIWLASNSAERALAAPGESLGGRDIGSVLAPLRTLLAGDAGGDRSVCTTVPSGERCEFGYSMSEVATDSSSPMYAIVFRDITRSARLASERDRLLHLASMGAAAPMVIHEVKNSLAAVSMGLELLTWQAEGAADREQSAALAAEASKAVHTLDGFGAVGRELRAGWRADLRPMLQDARSVLESRAQRHRVVFDFEVGNLDPVYLDPAVVHALLFNLVINAMKASDADDRVSVRVAIENEHFVLCVADTGRGMDAEELAHCTDLFFSTFEGGSGIGLALCHEAVKAADGSLTIDSEPGRGSTVTISVPLAQGAAR